MFQNLEIFEMSENTTSHQPTLFVAASPVNLTAFQEKEKHPKTIETYGVSTPVLFASVNQNGCWLKMSQGYYQARMDGSLVEFSGIWTPAGMMSNGKAYRLPRLVRRISARGSTLLPTMGAKESGAYQYSHGDHSKKAMTLTGYVRMYPTPMAGKRDASPKTKLDGKPNLAMVARSLDSNPNGGTLNPNWVEWLMGFPIGWTDLEASETP